MENKKTYEKPEMDVVEMPCNSTLLDCSNDPSCLPDNIDVN
jgi:hypothetical protein